MLTLNSILILQCYCCRLQIRHLVYVYWGSFSDILIIIREWYESYISLRNHTFSIFKSRTHNLYSVHVRHVQTRVRHWHLYDIDNVVVHRRLSLYDCNQQNNCGEVVLVLLEIESRALVDILEPFVVKYRRTKRSGWHKQHTVLMKPKHIINIWGHHPLGSYLARFSIGCFFLVI